MHQYLVTLLTMHQNLAQNLFEVENLTMTGEALLVIS